MIYTHVAATLVGAAFAAVIAWQVQDWRYGEQIAEREAQIAKAAQAAEAEARKREREMQRYADELSKDAARRQQVLADRAATTELVARGLRDDIVRLNTRPAPADPAAARFADDARAARELLGACAEEYRSVAQSADGLRDQVTGLQGWAAAVTKP